MRLAPLFSSCLTLRPIALTSFLASLLLVGCGGGSTPVSSPITPGANTNAVLMLTSTGNDKLQAFNLQLTSLILTSKAGNKVTLFSSNPYPNGYPDFIHLNGLTEPFLTVPIPQDTYVSATATVGGAQFHCVSIDPTSGSLNNSVFSYGATPAAQVTANLPQPITVTAAPLAIAIDLQSALSATYSNCVGGISTTYSINPTFNLEQLPFGNVNNASANGQPTTVQGTIASVNATTNSFTVTSSDGPTWNIATTSNTTFQGIGGVGALAAGQPIDADILFDTFGNIQARRIQVLDTNTSNLTYVAGPLTQLTPSITTVIMTPIQALGFFLQPGQFGAPSALNYSNAVFATSGYLSNLASLPFTPVFNASTLTDGQHIAITTHATIQQGGPTYVPVATVTLLPQTLNGTITNIATTGTGTSAVTAYTVSLAPYDLFPDLNVQQGQPTRLTSPSTAMVYVQNGNTGVASPTVGSPYRFTGLVFNDGGILKMDCLQILQGVTP